MTSLPFYEQVLIIAICAGATILTRLLPFLIFKPGSRLPGYVNFWERPFLLQSLHFLSFTA